MSCKLGDKCDNVFACNVLRPNVELLGCNFYKPKKPQTNEEWFCQLSTEEKAEWMAKHMNFCEVCKIQTCRGDGCQRFDRGMTETDAFREWLKEIHE